MYPVHLSEDSDIFKIPWILLAHVNIVATIYFNFFFSVSKIDGGHLRMGLVEIWGWGSLPVRFQTHGIYLASSFHV